MMTINEVSQDLNIPANTLRFYERVGLMAPIARVAGGERNYTPEDCDWVRFIHGLLAAGASCEAMIEYVALSRQGPRTKTACKLILAEQYESLTERIARMQATQTQLKQILDGFGDNALYLSSAKPRRTS